ncbi:hypothetical protein D3Z52_24415, partial [Clostridiaceae bacterium]|nr:hypothetical protein [Clostridiaceae bacterium]
SIQLWTGFHYFPFLYKAQTPKGKNNLVGVLNPSFLKRGIFMQKKKGMKQALPEAYGPWKPVHARFFQHGGANARRKACPARSASADSPHTVLIQPLRIYCFP